MLTTTAVAFFFAASISAMWPAWRAPIVGTSATFLLAIFDRSARQSAIVCTTCMGGKLIPAQGRLRIARSDACRIIRVTQTWENLMADAGNQEFPTILGPDAKFKGELSFEKG